MADSRDKVGDVKSAAAAYEQAVALDAKTGDAHVAALDWFNYGQFLRRHGMPDDLVYACLLHSEQLLANTGGCELETATKMRREVEHKLGGKASASQKQLPELLARAGGLPTYSFSSQVTSGDAARKPPEEATHDRRPFPLDSLKTEDGACAK